MIALDTNLLVYAHRAEVPQHSHVQRAIEQAAQDPSGWAIPFPCIAEFWSVVTHPAATGRPSRPKEAEAFLKSLLEAGARILYPKAGSADRFLQLATDLRIDGPRIFDLQIALVCLDHGVRALWTHDRNFLAVPGLSTKDPL